MHLEIHPMFVHFPIALAVVVVIIDWGRWIFARERILDSGFWGGTTPLLILALIGAIASVASGLIAEEGIVQTPVVHELIEAHEMAAFITTGLLAGLTFWRIGLRGRFPVKGTMIYLALILLAAVVVGYGSYFGGQMVYGHGVGVDMSI